MHKYLLKMKSNLHSHVFETVERVPATTITITSPYWNLVAMVDTQYCTPSGVKLTNEMKLIQPQLYLRLSVTKTAQIDFAKHFRRDEVTHLKL